MTQRISTRVLTAFALALLVIAIALGVMLHLRAATKADSRKDALSKAGIITIETAIFGYAKVHDHDLPQSDQVSAAGLSAYLPAGVSWPVNPFTGEPMHTGVGPGDIRYDRQYDHQYTIESVGTDGTSTW